MGNVEAHDFAPVRAEERKILNLSRKVTPKQYVKHLNGEFHEACLLEIPWHLRDSVSLYEFMTVAFNAITEIPVELPLRLPHLSNLDLSHNRIGALPESFGLLFHLKEIQLQHNRLSSLPDSFVYLVKLEKVDLSYNELRVLPDDIGKMERLARLNVIHNKLKILPLSLGSPLCRVHLLLAQQNRLESPPQAVCEEGSSSTLSYIRKQFSTHFEEIPICPVAPLNQFPRRCGNKLEPSVSNPHSAQIQYIQEKTNTSHITNRIKAPLTPPLNATTLTPFQLRDRMIGLVYGAAVGDSIAVACRWMSDDECAFHYGCDDDLVHSKIVQDEHRVLWRQGDWTANFDQFMLVFESLVNWAGVVDELEFARRLQAWSNKGFPDLGDTGGVITSETIGKVLDHPSFTENPHTTSSLILQLTRSAESGNDENEQNQSAVCSENGDISSESEAASTGASPQHARLKRLTSNSSLLPTLSITNHMEVAQKLVHTAPRDLFGVDNGAVVRTAILGVPNFHELHEVESNTVRICKTTHSDQKCVASCVFISLLIALLLQGKLLNIEDKERRVSEDELDIAFRMAAAHLSDKKDEEEFMELKNFNKFSSFNAREPSCMSHTYKPVKAAVIALHWKDDYRSFITALTKLAGDSSSNACVAGAVLGCIVGYSHLPAIWLNGLRKRQVQWLNVKVNHLLDIMGSP